MKQVLIVHGWGDKPYRGWFGWLKEQLEEKGVEVIAPQLPDRLDPKPEEWLATLNEVLPEPSEETVLIGHSLGGQGIVRYLDNRSPELRVGGVIFVGVPFVQSTTTAYADERKALRERWKHNIDYTDVFARARELHGFYSKDDYMVSTGPQLAFLEGYGIPMTVFEHRQHMSPTDGQQEFQEVLDMTLRMLDIA